MRFVKKFSSKNLQPPHWKVLATPLDLHGGGVDVEGLTVASLLLYN